MTFGSPAICLLLNPAAQRYLIAGSHKDTEGTFLLQSVEC